MSINNGIFKEDTGAMTNLSDESLKNCSNIGKHNHKHNVEVKTLDRAEVLALGFIILVTIYLGFILRECFSSSKEISYNIVHFTSIFTSIIIQAVPFVLLGVMLSSIIQILIPQRMIERLMPEKGVFKYITAILAGLFFPVCDCAIVPVSASLIKKGVPISAALTFMLSAPLVNPIVIASTFYAFPGRLDIVLIRLLMGLSIALAVGLYFEFGSNENSKVRITSVSCSCGQHHSEENALAKLKSTLLHGIYEFMDVVTYLVIGALVSAAFQTFMPENFSDMLTKGHFIPIVVMMLLAFVLSICSTSDAFVARSFFPRFPLESVMGFMVLGPMIDIKNIMMLISLYNKKFVAKLILVLIVVSFAFIYFFGSLFFM